MNLTEHEAVADRKCKHLEKLCDTSLHNTVLLTSVSVTSATDLLNRNSTAVPQKHIISPLTKGDFSILAKRDFPAVKHTHTQLILSQLFKTLQKRLALLI